MSTGPHTPPPPPGPKTPARQDVPLAAVGPDEPATNLDPLLDDAFGPVETWWIDPEHQLPPLPLLDPQEFVGGSAMYRGGYWTA